MIITRKQQIKIVEKYMKDNRTAKEGWAFMAGMDAMFKFMERIIKESKN